MPTAKKKNLIETFADLEAYLASHGARCMIFSRGGVWFVTFALPCRCEFTGSDEALPRAIANTVSKLEISLAIDSHEAQP